MWQWTMRILDIDLDFFLNTTRFWPSFGRPEDPTLRPWSPEAVQNFLEKQCGLRRDRPLPGLIVDEHHEVFFDWRIRIAQGLLVPPFEVVHLDAHADLGYGDASVPYVLTEVLGQPLKDRAFPRVGGREGLGPGNYLLFAIACRWIQALTYVYHPDRHADLPQGIVHLNAHKEGWITLSYYGPLPPEVFGQRRTLQPLAVEPPVPYREVSGAVYANTDGPFDLLYVARSPLYTPAEADRLLDVFRVYLCESATLPSKAVLRASRSHIRNARQTQPAKKGRPH